MKKHLIKLLFLFLLTSCLKQKPLKTKLLLDWSPNINHLPLVVGQELGIFLKYGIDLELILMQDPPSVTHFLLTTDAKLALYYYPSALVSSSCFKHFKIIAKLIDEPLYSFFSLKKDLNQSSFVCYGDPLSNRVIKSLEKNKTLFSNISYAHFDLLTHFFFNQAEVITGYANIDGPTLEKKEKPYHLFTWKDLKIPKYPELVVIAKKEFLETQKSFAKAFKAALCEACRYCQLNPREAFTLYLKVFPEKHWDLNYERKCLERSLPLFSSTQIFDEKELEEFERWFFEDENDARSFIYKKLLVN